MPLIANGDAYSPEDVRQIANITRADGVMAARGIMENPAMFRDLDKSNSRCVRDFLAWVIKCPIPLPLVLHHISEITSGMPEMRKKEKKVLMECADLLDLIDFVDEQWPSIA